MQTARLSSFVLWILSGQLLLQLFLNRKSFKKDFNAILLVMFTLSPGRILKTRT
jgi:hypothetical protein